MTRHTLNSYSCPTDIYMQHFTDTRYTDITVTYTHRTSVHACIVSIFLSSLYILYILLFHVIPVCMLYDYFLLLIWISLLRDMRAVDMRYVEFHIYCSRFPLYCSCYIVPVILFPFHVIMCLVILFYAINRALFQLSGYLYHVQ